MIASLVHIIWKKYFQIYIKKYTFNKVRKDALHYIQ